MHIQGAAWLLHFRHAFFVLRQPCRTFPQRDGQLSNTFNLQSSTKSADAQKHTLQCTL